MDEKSFGYRTEPPLGAEQSSSAVDEGVIREAHTLAGQMLAAKKAASEKYSPKSALKDYAAQRALGKALLDPEAREVQKTAQFLKEAMADPEAHQMLAETLAQALIRPKKDSCALPEVSVPQPWRVSSVKLSSTGDSALVRLKKVPDPFGRFR